MKQYTHRSPHSFKSRKTSKRRKKTWRNPKGRNRPKDLSKKTTVTLKPDRYQPTKKQIEEEVSLPVSPERLRKAMVRDVNIRRDKE